MPTGIYPFAMEPYACPIINTDKDCNNNLHILIVNGSYTYHGRGVRGEGGRGDREEMVHGACYTRGGSELIAIRCPCCVQPML